MKQYNVTYKGALFPVYEVDMADVIGCPSCITLVSCSSLWETMENDWEQGDREAIKLDEDIWYYCEDSFFDTNPNYSQLVEYLKKVF